MDDIVLLRDLEEIHRFSLTYRQETTNVRIGCTGTRTRPPFSRLNVWRPHEQEPEAYDVRVNLVDAIVEGKFYPIFLKKDISV